MTWAGCDAASSGKGRVSDVARIGALAGCDTASSDKSRVLDAARMRFGLAATRLLLKKGRGSDVAWVAVWVGCLAALSETKKSRGLVAKEACGEGSLGLGWLRGGFVGKKNRGSDVMEVVAWAACVAASTEKSRESDATDAGGLTVLRLRLRKAASRMLLGFLLALAARRLPVRKAAIRMLLGLVLGHAARRLPLRKAAIRMLLGLVLALAEGRLCSKKGRGSAIILVVGVVAGTLNVVYCRGLHKEECC